MNVKAATCPPHEILSNFGLGKLDAPTLETIGAHLETCADCRQIVAGLSGDSFVDRLRDAQGQPPISPAPPARARTFAAGESIPNVAYTSETSLPASGKRQLAGAPATGRTPPPANIPPELADHPDYELLKELGHGGMGVVYLARNRMMDRLEVLKVVSKSLLDRPGALERFQQEIRSAAKLSHPNIVAAYTVLRPGDLLVFAMEYVDGQDLSQVVKQRGPLPVTNATFYAQQVALGLQHAHEKEMVHRDIKPNNLMLAIVNKKHVVKILDFGLAKATSEKAGDHGLTKSGQMMGTPDYIAPEQTLDAQKADIRADIYSLGCTLYYLLAGETPFHGNSLYEILQAHHQTAARPLNLVRTDVPIELATIVSKMMAKEPAQRYQTPMEVAKALNPFFKAGAHAAAARAEMSLPPAASIVAPVAIPIPIPSPGREPGDQSSLRDGANPGAHAPGSGAVAAAVPMAVPATPLPVAQPIPVAASPLASLEGIDSVPSPRLRKKSKALRRRPGVPIAIGLLLVGMAVCAGLIFKFRTADGVVVVTANVPNPEVLVDGNHITVTWAEGGKQAEIHVPPGSHKIELTKDGFTAFGETVSIASAGQELLAATLEPLSKPRTNTPSPSPGREPGGSSFVGSPSSGATGSDSVLPSAVASTTGSKYQWPSGTPAAAIAPFDAKKARAHQEGWAMHLGVPVEQTNSIGMKLVLIPPGEFLMGSTPEQISAAEDTLSPEIRPEYFRKIMHDELPQHRVTITRPFFMGATEVTAGQFRKFVEAAKYVTEAERFGFGHSSATKLDDSVTPEQKANFWYKDVEELLHVRQVTWNDAVAFCNWLSDQEKLQPCYRQDAKDGWVQVPATYGYRLPTEAEWEYACRAGTTTKFSFGDDIRQLEDYAIARRRSVVGSKLANSFGLYDMHGNAFEWCQDWFAAEYYLTSPAADPPGPPSGTHRIIRGGNSGNSLAGFRSACRLGNLPIARYTNTGFRVVRAAPATGASPASAANAKNSRATPPPGSTDAAPGAAPPATPPVSAPAPKPAPVGPPPAIAPFDAKQSRAHQEAWAKHLGVPVVQTNSIGMKLVLIPPGEFLMGSTPKQIQEAEELVKRTHDDHTRLGRIRSEGPQHRETIRQPFLFGATEVTIEQFRRFVDTTGFITMADKFGAGTATTQDDVRREKSSRTWSDPDHPVTDRSAVDVVSWFDAIAFCNWLSEKENLTPSYRKVGEDWALFPAGNGYRLPAEAEWEYACRAGTTTHYFSGDDAATVEAYGWLRATPSGEANDELVVGLKLPNPFGLFDIHGNVGEWCQDLERGASPRPDEIVSTTAARLWRGGGGGVHARSAFRTGYPPRWRFMGLGFRVVCVNAIIPSALAGKGPTVSKSDPIAAALDKAKQSYDDKLGSLLDPVLKALDHREAVARTARDKQLIDLIKQQREAFESRGEIPTLVPTTDYQRQLYSARSRLETAYEAAIRGFTKAKLDTQAEEATRDLTSFRQHAPAPIVEFGGKRYKAFDQRLTWHQAQAKCVELGGHLPIIVSAAENEFVAALTKSQGLKATWLGATDEKSERQWVWVNGAALGYANWDRGQPNNLGAVEHFAILAVATMGKWWDYPNDPRQFPGKIARGIPGFICEWDEAPGATGPGNAQPRAIASNATTGRGSATSVPRAAAGRPGGALPAATSDGFISLFNGRDLTGWKTHPDNQTNWRVSDGILVGNGSDENGHLFSIRGDYKDFDFRVHVRINEGGNAGQCFRTQFFGLGQLRGRGYEAQINATARDPAKTGSLMHFGDTTVVKAAVVPADQWFTQEVIADGPHIVIKVNGKTSVDFIDAQRTYTSGHLALQAFGPATVVEFRKIEIKELSSAGSVPDVAVSKPDPIAATLERARANYQTKVENLRDPIIKNLDRAEEAARAKGDTKAVAQIKAEREAVVKQNAIPSVIPAIAYFKQLINARQQMESAYTSAIKAYMQAKQDQQARGVEDDQMRFRATRPTPADAKYSGGKYYKAFEEKLRWHQAQAACAAMGGHLAAVKTVQENQFLLTLLEGRGIAAAWLGATDEQAEGKWIWVDGSPLSYSNWDSSGNQPNNKAGSEHYLVMQIRRGGQWCDQPDNSTEQRPGFICQWD